jgi:hypothetical protein
MGVASRAPPPGWRGLNDRESAMQNLSLSQKKRGLNIHAFVFVATMILLVAINLWKGEPYWVLWVLLGWGIGLVAHWFFTLGPGADTDRSA